jgi:hypothetical protein
MPRIKNETDALLADLTARIGRLVETAKQEGRDDALAEVRQLTGATAASGKRARRSAKPAKPRSAKPRKNSWANLTPKARLARINAMRKGRGLPPKKKL